MAIGDKLRLNGQYQINGYVMGPGTRVWVEKVEGLLGAAPNRSQDRERAGIHGSYLGRPRLESRQIIMDIAFRFQDSPDELLPEIDEFKRQVMVVPPDYEWYTNTALAFKKPGWSSRMVIGQPRQFDLVSDYDTATGWGVAKLEFKTSEPYIYSCNPVDLIHSHSGTSSQFTFAPLGVVPSKFYKIEITGTNTGTTSIYSNTYPNAAMVLGPKTTSGTWILDARNRSLVANNVDISNMIKPQSRWFDMGFGIEQTIVINTSVSASLQFTVSHYPAWN